MKAYFCRDEKRDDDFATIVFAETRGKAKAIALHCDACEDAEFKDITARRVPALDKYYKGNSEMDWFDEDDRVAMVKESGFYCTYEISCAELQCDKCQAKQWCSRYDGEDGNAE